MNMKKLLIVLTALVVLGAGTAVFRHYRGHGGQAAQQKELYYCPMHPNYTADKPGDCPICGMHLVKKEAAAPAVKKVLVYRNPMNPEITSKVPMKDQMGMDYLPVYEGGAASTAVDGRSAITLDAGKRQMIGVKTTQVGYRNLGRVIRAPGKVAYDPGLYQAISEYREALAAREKVKNSSWPDVIERADALVAASKLRLRQMGASPEQLAPGKDQPADTSLLLPSAKAWIYAQIYEYEIALVKPGLPVYATATAWPGEVFKGELKALDPILSTETRTLRVKAEVGNHDMKLKPEMYVDLMIRADLGMKLAAPNAAILNTGERELVFVEKSEGEFEPRAIKTGLRTDDYTEVLSGLKAGEKVVTSANFLVDSESRLKAALAQ